jgi:predicted RND superfamily exporter protein
MREQLLKGIFFIVRRYAWAVLLVSVLLSAGGLYYIRDLQMRSAFLDLLPHDDPLLNRFKEREEVFQKADAVTIVLSCIPQLDSAGREYYAVSPEACQANLVELAEQWSEILCPPEPGASQTVGGRRCAQREGQEIITVNYFKDPEAVEGELLLSMRDRAFLDIQRQMTELKDRLGGLDPSQGESPQLAQIYRQFNQVLDQIQPLFGERIRSIVDLFKLPQAVQLYEGVQQLKQVNQAAKRTLEQIPGQLESGRQALDNLLETLGRIEETLQRLLEFRRAVNFSKDGYALRLDARPRYSSQRGLEYSRQIRDLLHETLERPQIKNQLAEKHLKAEYAGTYILMTEHNQVINLDMKTTIISAIGITAVIVLTLQRWLYPLMAMVSLFVALIWTFAWAKFSVGGLNLVTSFLPSLILGLGIDYGINFIAHFLEEQRRGRRLSRALYHTILYKGGALITASLTTSLVLFSLMLSSSPGLVELGIIAGMGVFLSLVATLFLLPSLLLVTHLMSRRPRRPAAGRRIELLWYGRAIQRARWGILIAVVVTSLFIAKDAVQVGFRFLDEDLAPKDLPSQIVMRKQVRERFEVGPAATEYFLFFTRDREELERVTGQLQEIQNQGQGIDAIFSLALFVPADSMNLEEITRQFDLEALLEGAHRGLNTLDTNLREHQELLEEVVGLSKKLNSLKQLAFLVGPNETFKNELGTLIDQLRELQCLLERAPTPPPLPNGADTTSLQEYKAQLAIFLDDPLQTYLQQCPPAAFEVAAYTNQMTTFKRLLARPPTTLAEIIQADEYQDLLELLQSLQNATLDAAQLRLQIEDLRQKMARLQDRVEELFQSAAPLQELTGLLQHLPQDLRERFVTRNGEYVIYAHVPPSIIRDREEFQKLKQKIEPIGAGALSAAMIPAQLEKSMKWDFTNSTYVAALIIFVVLAVGLRGLPLGALWGILPVGLGVGWMLAGMRYLGIDFNFANIVISPLLIGSGVDFAVYLIDSYTRHRQIEIALSETALPILGTALTIMVSFGSLLFATTPGLQMFGKSALLGIGFTTLFTLVLLPALLALRRD